MSLPSVETVLQERGLTRRSLRRQSGEVHEEILWEAMQRDLGPAIRLLHQASHRAQKSGTGAAFVVRDPNSEVGRMLIRIAAGTELRALVEKRACHSMPLSFINCCKTKVGGKGAPKSMALEQLLEQTRPGRRDC